MREIRIGLWLKSRSSLNTAIKTRLVVDGAFRIPHVRDLIVFLFLAARKLLGSPFIGDQVIFLGFAITSLNYEEELIQTYRPDSKMGLSVFDRLAETNNIQGVGLDLTV